MKGGRKPRKVVQERKKEERKKECQGRKERSERR